MMNFTEKEKKYIVDKFYKSSINKGKSVFKKGLDSYFDDNWIVDLKGFVERCRRKNRGKI